MDLSNIQGRYTVKPLNRKLLSVWVFFLMLMVSNAIGGSLEIGLILGCIAAAVIFFITEDEEEEFFITEDEDKPDEEA